MIESTNTLKIGTWNLCLGLANKKDIVTQYLRALNIKICCLQETEILSNFPVNILNCGNYTVELENNTEKRRVGIYLHKDIKYIRRFDLEKLDRHIVIVDIIASRRFRLINLYRSFRPQGRLTPQAFFKEQLIVLKNALTKDCLVMGDFNLDVNMTMRPDYPYKIPLENLTDFANFNNLTQIVNFNTWSRTVNGTRKESLLDHVYVDDISLIQNLSYNEPTFGDHLLVITELILRNVVEQKTITRRDWRNYTRMGLICNLLFRDGLDTLNVQAMWNSIEHSIIVAADVLMFCTN